MQSINEFVIKKIPAFTLDISISEVVDCLIDNEFTHFPVVSDGVFLGNIALNDAETFSEDQCLTAVQSAFEIFFVRETSTWFDVLEVFSKNRANVVPILDSENKYIGYYLFDDIILFMNETPFMNELGVTVVVEKNIFEYSLSQVSQIFESNNSKILGIIVSKIENETAQIIIKAISVNLNEVIQTLRRYEYHLVSEHEEDQFLNDLKERSEYLNKYLNI